MCRSLLDMQVTSKYSHRKKGGGGEVPGLAHAKTESKWKARNKSGESEKALREEREAVEHRKTQAHGAGRTRVNICCFVQHALTTI